MLAPPTSRHRAHSPRSTKPGVVAGAKRLGAAGGCQRTKIAVIPVAPRLVNTSPASVIETAGPYRKLRVENSLTWPVARLHDHRRSLARLRSRNVPVFPRNTRLS